MTDLYFHKEVPVTINEHVAEFFSGLILALSFVLGLITLATI